MSQLGSRGGTPTRIAYHSGKIADDENRLVAQILKLPQLSQHDGVSEMNIGGCWIDSQFYPQRPPKRELIAQLILADDLRGALF
jgi:hypothetical protein